MADLSWLVVARREFLERVRTWWFAVVTLLGPIGMVALIVVPALLGKASEDKPMTIHMVDHTCASEGAGCEPLGPRIAATLTRISSRYRIEIVPPSTSTDELLGRIRDENIDGFLVLPDELPDGGVVAYRGANVTNLGAMIKIESAVQKAIWEVRFERSGMDSQRVFAMMMPVEFTKTHTTGEAEGTSGEASFVVGYVTMFILYMAILLYAVNVLRSVVQEKTSRVVEIVVSAVKPRSLMLGKVLGVGSVGLFQLSIWIVMGTLLLVFREQVLGVFGVSGGKFSVPSIGIDAVAVVLSFFLCGYFFYASLYAAIGAMVNSDQEAQQAQTPVVLLLVIPVACVQLVANDPRGGAAEALTLIPFASPVLMPMRYLLGGASGGDVALSLAILLAATAGAVWLAARIYRVGILMYGKRPSLRELVRWIKYQ